MIKWFKGGWFWLLVITFLFLAVIRLHDYDRVPGASHAEELLYGWSGIHLIETGEPVSWSTLDYPDENLVFDGIVGDKNGVYLPAKLYKPWVDEPPLYSLLAGGASHLYGDDREMVLPTSHTRIPSVLASLITLGLVFWVGYHFFGFWAGYMAMLVYGVSPIMVFGSRLSVPENIIALMTLMSLAMMPKYDKKPSKWMAGVWGVMAVIGGLMKPTGFFIAPLMMFVSARKKRWADVLIILLLTLAGVGLFVAYGYWLDWELFKTIVEIQGVRFAGWTGLAYIFNSPGYDIWPMFDGWYIFALLSTIFFAFKSKKCKELGWIVLFWVYWLMVAVFSGTEQDMLPWYRYPMFPLMAIMGGLGLIKFLKDVRFVNMALAVGLLLSGRYFLHNAFRPTTDPNVFRVVYLLLVSPSLNSPRFYILSALSFVASLYTYHSIRIIVDYKRNNPYLKESLKAIDRQTYTHFEIILVTDYPVNLTHPKLKKKSYGHYVGPAQKRDDGAKLAKGSILSFLDDDAYPSRDWLKNIITNFADPKVAAVGGPGVTPPHAHWTEQASGWASASPMGASLYAYRFIPEKKRLVDDFPSMNLSVRKSDFNKVKGFDSHYYPGEDTKLCLDLTHKLGKQIVYDPKALVYHHRRPILFPHLKQNGNFGLHRGFFARTLPKTSLRPLYFLPSLMVLGLIFLLFSPIYTHPLLYLVTQIGRTLLGFYLASLCLNAIWILNYSHQPLQAFLSLPVIFLTHFWYGIRFIQGFLFTRKLSR